MKTALFPKFKELYDVFLQSKEHEERVKQLGVIPIFKEIIVETLKIDPLSNEHFTGLIQMFKHSCSPDIFEKYLTQNVSEIKKRVNILDDFKKLNQCGYSGAGLNVINKLNANQITIVKQFLEDAFQVKTIDQAVNLCTEFDTKNIPHVKSGIYSPWLYYINSKIFPILNNSHLAFRNWIGIKADYPSVIRDFNTLKDLVEASDLGTIDKFAHNFEDITKPKPTIQLIDLKGNRLFKISHGLFKNDKEFKKTNFLGILEKNKWICIHGETGKGQSNDFENVAKEGDYIYVCYGGDDLYCVGQITSESKNLDKISNDIFSGDGKWIYREFKPLYFPRIPSVRELKKDTRFFMPSGNSTFYQVPIDQLDYLNSKIFIPKVEIKFIVGKEDYPFESDFLSKKSLKNMSYNSILFGPPGTGKTYHSINHAVAIVENEEVKKIASEKRVEVKKRFDKYVVDGRIVFCTFHQSLSYEDFIEGIKPIEPISEDEELSYAVVDGIFKRLCTEAAFSFIQKNTTIETEKVLDFSTEYDRFVDTVNESFSKGVRTELETRSGGNVYIESISQKNNIWVRHLDGNRKYTVSKKRLSKISQAFPELSEVTNINDQFRAEIGGSNSSAYWAVLNSIRKQPANTTSKDTKTFSEKEYSYDDKKEIIESLNNDDYKIENPKKFVLIIDEINRGNVSQIFGELITLIEDDKRLGKEEALKATLPYSKDSFGVPCNISIIGTMNTADRSVEALDTALRRRFSFVQIAPKPDELKITSDDINLPEILKVLNTRLSVLKDYDHTIGHAWLWNVSDLSSLKIVFSDKILPLLQEYFYNDYEKLGLVLGDTFFKQHVQINSNIFASFTGGNGLAGQYDQTWQYQLKSTDELTIADFKSLELHNNKPEPDEE